MNPDRGAAYNCRPCASSHPPTLRVPFQILLCAGGTGGKLKGICDLIITPSPHLHDPAASISLSAPLSRSVLQCHFPSLAHSFSSVSLSIFHPISVFSVSHSLFWPSPQSNVGCTCHCWTEGSVWLEQEGGRGWTTTENKKWSIWILPLIWTSTKAMRSTDLSSYKQTLIVTGLSNGLGFITTNPMSSLKLCFYYYNDAKDVCCLSYKLSVMFHKPRYSATVA